MDALRFNFKERTLELVRTEIPEVTLPTDILIKISYSGICGTDLHILRGEYPCGQSADITLGHEIVGEIVEVGYDVIHFQEGDRVAVDPNRGCKRCAFCHGGKPHFCKVGCSTNTIGIYRDGGWAQYVVCPEEQVYKIKSTVALDEAVLAEPLSCLIHGWERISPITVGSKILICGAGMMGTLWACTLHLQGHRNVTVSEPNQLRLEAFRKLNTSYRLVTPNQILKESYLSPELVNFDIVIDTSGNPEAVQQGISWLNYGGKLCIFGVASKYDKVEILPYDVFWKEIKILGSRNNPFTFQKALGLIESLGNRYLGFTILGVKVFSLTQFKEAIEAMKKGLCIKAVFRMV